MQGLMWRAVNPDGTLVYSFVESVKATFPFYVVRLLGRPALPRRHVSDGLERGDDGEERPAPRPRRFPPSRWRTPEGGAHGQPTTRPTGHEKIETSNFLMIVLILVTVAIGGIVEIVPLYFQRSTTRGRAGSEALHGAAARRPRHLRARGLLQLPLADDPAVPRRDAALRPVLHGRRVRLRPPVPVGQQAHRARSAPRRRPLQRRVAPRAPDQPARPGARVEHAGLSVAGARRSTRPRCRPSSRALRRLGVPYSDADVAGAAKRSRARPNSMR